MVGLWWQDGPVEKDKKKGARDIIADEANKSDQRAKKRARNVVVSAKKERKKPGAKGKNSKAGPSEKTKPPSARKKKRNNRLNPIHSRKRW